eukprot:53377_1
MFIMTKQIVLLLLITLKIFTVSYTRRLIAPVDNDGFPTDIEIKAKYKSGHYWFQGQTHAGKPIYERTDGKQIVYWVEWAWPPIWAIYPEITNEGTHYARCSSKNIYECNSCCDNWGFSVNFRVETNQFGKVDYSFYELYNGTSSYRSNLQINGSYYYIYYDLHSTTWKLSDQIGGTNVYAQCNETNIFECGSIATQSGQIDFSSGQTRTPSLAPTIEPTFDTIMPTFYPNTFPTISPTTCYNDDVLSQSISVNYYNNNPNNIYTPSYVNIAESTIFCDNIDGNICNIECNTIDGCINSTVYIQDIETFSTLLINCSDAFSCYGMSINVLNSFVTKIDILCSESYACVDIKVNISKSLQMNVVCIEDNSCDNLIIIGDSDVEHIDINLTMNKFSSNIFIYYPYIDNINVICKSLTQKRYIKYNTDKIINQAKLKQ